MSPVVTRGRKNVEKMPSASSDEVGGAAPQDSSMSETGGNLSRYESLISVRSVGSSHSSSRSYRSALKDVEREARKKELQIESEMDALKQRQRSLERKREIIQLDREAEKDKIMDEADTSDEENFDIVSMKSGPIKPYDPVAEIAEAMKNAIYSIKPQQQPLPTADMKTMLARQSVAKELPMFWGEPEEWPTFVKHLERSTELCEFSDEENVYRLQRCLKGKAREAVHSMLAVGANFMDIMKTLELRFGQPEQIMRILIDKIRQVPAPSESKMESIVDFSIAVKNLAVTADTMNRPEYLMNPQLMEEMVKKLPPHLRLDWGSYAVESNMEAANLLGMSRWLEKKATAAMRVVVCNEEKSPESTSTGNRKKPDRSFVAVEEKKRTCVAGCSEMHQLPECKQFSQLSTEQRWKLVKRVRLCFCCLKFGHQTKDCRKKKKCTVNNCDKYHHQLLHYDEDLNKSVPKDKISFSGHSLDSDKCQVLLRVVPVTVKGPNKTVQTFALCDEGSTTSFMEESLAEELELEGEETSLNLAWLHGEERKQKSLKVEAWISGEDETEYKLKNVKTIRNLDLPVHTVKATKIKTKWTHLRGIPVQSLHNAKPRILLGQDNCQLTMPRRIVEGPSNAPVATMTKLGWILHGPNNPYHGLDLSFFVDEKSSGDEFGVGSSTDDGCGLSSGGGEVLKKSQEIFENKLHQMVKEQFSLDALGVVSCEKLPRSKQDNRAEQMMFENTRRVGDSWETCMLWKEDSISLPESKTAAYHRLKIIEKQMDKNEEFGKMYTAKIEEYLQKGFCRKLSSAEASIENERIWYLPHFGTTNPNKPGKVRLVFDCAAKSNGMSLNDALLQGPDLMTPLISVLAKFRQKEVAFSGDIRDMFHMVKIKKEDLPSLRFLWRGKERNMYPDVYTMDVMVFGAVSSPFQAQWVKNRNAEDFRAEFGETTEVIVDCHYVDDYLDSAATPEEAIKKIEVVREIHKRGGFEIRNWVCNSPEVLAGIGSTLSSSSLDFQEEAKLERVLGLYWDPTADVFRFKKKFRTVKQEIISGVRVPTKREVLKIVMCIFDPLGFVSHLTVRAKILIQDIWRMGLGWDDKLPETLQAKWKIFVKTLDNLPKVNIPRCYAVNISNAQDIQLHIMCDASEQAYCGVAYLRIKINGIIKVNIVMGKSRVSPLRPISIPRLELQAALVGARMANWIKQNHTITITSTIIWSDSRNVLCWLRAEDPRKFKPYVSHRIGEILELTDVSMWRWIPTALNVSDDGTRDITPADLTEESRWFIGPEFLYLEESQWPVETENNKNVNENNLEMKKDFVLLTNEENFVNLEEELSWSENLQKVAFLKNNDEQPNVDMLLDAEMELLKSSQWSSFQEEISILQMKKDIPKSSRLLRFLPYLDDKGVLRMKSRLVESPELCDAAASPVILDSKEMITKKIVDHYHQLFNHQGQEIIVNEIRQRYWILGIRSAVRSAWKRCVYCQKGNAKPAQAQMAPLPDFRVTKVNRPFTIVGIDFFGPMEVVLKRYGLIFVCMNTRAIHIEITHSLTTESTLMAIERFSCRRGIPEKIWSDNGTSFIGADRALKKCLDEIKDDELLLKLIQKGISWSRVPAVSPHFAGSWGRLIRCTKKALAAIMKNRTPTDEMLLSFMVEAEAIVNSRPLTFVSLDNGDVEAITPNSFLIGTTSYLRPPGKFSDDDLTHKNRWRIGQIYADHLWRRWVKEFLPTLAVRQKWLRKGENLKLGDRVLIVDGNMPRNTWITGVVVKTHPGKDGQVRVVDVETANGVYRRPIVKLCPIIVEAAQGSDRNDILSLEGV